ncbi:hypothetical protein [Streptomyces sp. NBC_01618]|nr:hypothetical protein OH735_03980 [Streptomyces sp. NBC_01618]
MSPDASQIAELAAQGLTNRDIAARLYLSPCRSCRYGVIRTRPY